PADLDLRTRASDLDASPPTGTSLSAPSSAPASAPASGPAGGEAPLVNRIDFDLRWRGIAFAGRADTGPEITFFETGRTFPLRGHIEVPGARIEVDGRAGDLFRGLRIDAATVASGTTLAGLAPIIGARGAEPRSFRAAARLVVDDAVYRFQA